MAILPVDLGILHFKMVWVRNGNVLCVHDLATDTAASASLGDDDCPFLVVLAVCFIFAVGVVMISRAIAARCGTVYGVCYEAWTSYRQNGCFLREGEETKEPYFGAAPSTGPDPNEIPPPTTALFYGSDLSGSDARNLIVGLCCVHNCSDEFIKLLLTLLGRVILRPRKTLYVSQGLPNVSIGAGAKQFFVDCEGQLHVKKKKCLRSLQATLLEDRNVKY